MNTPKHLAQQAADGMGMTILDLNRLCIRLREDDSDLSEEVFGLLEKAEALSQELHDIWALIK